MGLLQQLKLLMWKNFVIRRRQKVRVAVEVLWPLSLFILLMLVRSKGLYLRVHECHFEAKPLPSSGQFLFWQGVVCSLNNTCHDNKRDAERNYSNVASSDLSLLLNDAEAFTEMAVNNNEKQFASLIAEINFLADDLRNGVISKKNNGNRTSQQSGEVTNFSNLNLEKLTKIHQQIDKHIKELEPQMEIVNLLKRINISYENITGIVRAVPAVNDIFVRLHNFMCGNSSKITIDMMLEPNHGVDKLRGYLDSIQDGPATIEYKYDPDATKECNAIYEKLETSPQLKFIWRFMKPFIRGKIIYAPNTTVISRIMSRVKDHTASPVVSNFTKTQNGSRIDDNSVDLAMKDLEFLSNLYKTQNSSDDVLSTMLAKAFLPSIHKAHSTLRSYREVINELNNEKLATIGKQLSEILKCYTSITVEHFSTEEEAEVRSMALSEKNELLAQITFNNSSPDKLDPFVRYKIRMNAERISDSAQFSLSNGPNYKPFEELKLITYGFVYLQDMVELSIIREHTNRTDTPGYILKQLPHPCFVEDWFLSSLGGMFPMFMVLSWVYTSSMIIKSIVYEKEQKLKETMRVLGMNNGIHWLSWFLDSITPMIITVFVFSTVLVCGGVVANAEYTLVVLFLLCYSISTITMCFLVSVFFSKANLAASSGGIIFFITYLPFPLIDAWFPHIPPLVKELGSLLSNVALGMGSKYFALRELEGTGAKWSNVASSPFPDDGFSIIKIMFIFIIDAILYFILAWYIEKVFPGTYGIPKSWYFPFMLSYWFPNVSKGEPDNSSNKDKNALADTDTTEAEPVHLQKGVSIKKLTKIYKNGKKAIEQLSLNFYQDQITAFLGTNGAGKTTTISILTGLFAPTSGTVEIYGQDIRTKINYIRRSLGICPQYNILFPELTVQEHLWFFARLKGLSAGKVQVEVQTILTDLGFYHKRLSFARHLSGGMKRKLSIAIAFIGGSQTVVLDEPTAGVDPYSRIGIWSLLLKYKKGRTIILTTHNMAEAELLGDRIAIVDAGKLVCCGSNSFLKSRFGWGYVLTIDCYVEDPLNESIADVFKKLTSEIVQIIPDVNVIEKFGTEIKFNLPKVSGNIKLYQTLLEFLVTNKSSLGISSFGFSDTTLEEIFLKLTADKNRGNKLGSDESKQSLAGVKSDEPRSVDRFWDKKSTILCTQLWALLRKRLWRSRRNKLELSMQLLLPSILISFCMVITKDLVVIDQPRPLILDMSTCPRSSTPNAFYTCTSFYQTPPNHSQWTTRYVDSLKGPSGFGISCVRPADDRRFSRSYSKRNWCLKSSVQSKLEGKYERSIKQCSCATGKFTCDFNASLGDPETLITSTKDVFYDLTDQDVEDWILTSYGIMNSRYGKQEGKRTGGFTLGVELLMKGKNISTQFNVRRPNKIHTPRVKSHGLTNRAKQKKNVEGKEQEELCDYSTDGCYGDIVAAVGNSGLANWTAQQEALPKNYKAEQLGMTENTEIKGTTNAIAKDFDSNAMDNIKIWFNNKWPLSSAVYLNGINNAVLRASVPMNESQYYGIQATIQGMNLTWQQIQTKMSRKTTTGLLHSVCILFSLSFVPASFTIYLIEDRVTGCKHLQLLSGVNWVVYWLHAFFWDLICHSFSSFICVLTLICFQEEAYVGTRSLPSLTILMLLFGWSNIPLMYAASFLFKVTSSAFVALSCFNISVGVLTTAATYVLRLFEDESLREIKNALANIFLIFPHFCLGEGLMKMTETYFMTIALAGFDVNVKLNLMAWNHLGKNLLFMFIEGLVFFVAVLCYEKFQRSLGLCSEQMISIEPPANLDEDVENERRRILNLKAEGEVLLMKCLTKVYKPQNHVAVNQLCLGIDNGQCFGLIGLNGAGKTSTFKMLTGDTSITFGDATILGHSVRDNLNAVRSQIGYCPQFDALDSKLTPTEHLSLYASLRNISRDKIVEAVNSCLKSFDLWKYRDICSRYLSGGNKRKLSTAIAILGDPQLIFLDEPTSGMDPKARRFLWSKIKDCVSRGQSVVLTSHSMSECEALCSRLSIMVNGQFTCLGSVQHLKNKFGKGYNLIIRVPLEKITQVKKLVAQKIPEGVEKSENYTQIKYHLDVETISLSNVLSVLEDAREDASIIDYSLSQKSLAEIFLNFVSHQSQAKLPNKTNNEGCRWLFCCSDKSVASHLSSSEEL